MRDSMPFGNVRGPRLPKLGNETGDGFHIVLGFLLGMRQASVTLVQGGFAC